MQVAVVKYNAGNIFSVMNALRRLGVEPLLTDDATVLRQADRVVFPGQGEASTAMAYLHQHGLDQVIRSLQQPVLGICIGQQLLCRHSEEGDVDCLGIFDAEVKRFCPTRHEDKVPCMGWNSLHDVKGELFEEDSYVYFVHSYYVPLSRRQPRPTTFCPTLPPCTRTTSTPRSSIRKRAAAWVNVSSKNFWSYD